MVWDVLLIVIVVICIDVCVGVNFVVIVLVVVVICLFGFVGVCIDVFNVFGDCIGFILVIFYGVVVGSIGKICKEQYEVFE